VAVPLLPRREVPLHERLALKIVQSEKTFFRDYTFRVNFFNEYIFGVFKTLSFHQEHGLWLGFSGAAEARGEVYFVVPVGVVLAPLVANLLYFLLERVDVLHREIAQLEVVFAQRHHRAGYQMSEIFHLCLLPLSLMAWLLPRLVGLRAYDLTGGLRLHTLNIILLLRTNFISKFLEVFDQLI